MIRYGIIQLSDLQFGPKHRFGSPSKIHDSISYDVMNLSKKYQFLPIYILLTGDITETAHADEFIEAGEVLQKIAGRISIDKDSIGCGSFATWRTTVLDSHNIPHSSFMFT